MHAHDDAMHDHDDAMQAHGDTMHAHGDAIDSHFYNFTSFDKWGLISEIQQSLSCTDTSVSRQIVPTWQVALHHRQVIFQRYNYLASQK